ncbi:MAG: helix-hairpin-helix domain-containing protein [Promethearchaeota archaeon]
MSEKVIAIVKSSSRDKHLREGRGYSLPEIQETGKNIKLLKELGIRIDYRRKTIHKFNVEKLKVLEAPKKKAVKKEPFKPKEKKKKKKKIKPIQKKEELKEATREKAKKAKAKKVKEKKRKVEPKKKVSEQKEEIIEKPKEEKKKKKEKIPTEEPIPLTKLPGCGPATAKKLTEIGISCVQDLIEEDPEEIGMLIKGVSAERVKEWQEEGKKLIKK